MTETRVDQTDTGTNICEAPCYTITSNTRPSKWSSCVPTSATEGGFGNELRGGMAKTPTGSASSQISCSSLKQTTLMGSTACGRLLTNRYLLTDLGSLFHGCGFSGTRLSGCARGGRAASSLQEACMLPGIAHSLASHRLIMQGFEPKVTCFTFPHFHVSQCSNSEAAAACRISSTKAFSCTSLTCTLSSTDGSSHGRRPPTSPRHQIRSSGNSKMIYAPTLSCRAA